MYGRINVVVVDDDAADVAVVVFCCCCCTLCVICNGHKCTHTLILIQTIYVPDQNILSLSLCAFGLVSAQLVVVAL